MENQVTSHAIKGILLSAIIILISIITYVFNLYEIKALGFLTPALILIGILFSVYIYAKQKNNTIAFGDLFAHGFVTTCVVISLTSVYIFISFQFLFPDLLDKMLIIQRKQLMENPKVKEEMIEPAINFTKKYFIPLALAGNIISTAIFGVIGSLIGAAVSKKNTNPFENTPTI